MRTSESRLGILAKQYIDLEQRWYYAALIDSRSPRLCNLHFDIIVGLSPLTGLMALLGLSWILLGSVKFFTSLRCHKN